MMAVRCTWQAPLAVMLLWSLACAAHNGRVPAPEPSTAADSARRASAGASQTLTAEEIDGPRATRIEEVLQGRVAGVEVFRTPNGEYSVRVRSAGSFLANDEPLYVLDGVQIRGQTGRNALSALVVSDIARIEVLKDAAAAAAYGSQGANGVIVITTKRRR